MLSGICYYPDGTADTEQVIQPCDLFNNVYSMCCGTNHTDDGVRGVCQPNGFCLTQYNTTSAVGEIYWREGCTDPTWQSPNCLRNVCADPSTGYQSANAPLTQCSDGTWCCGQNNSTCCDKKLGVSVAATLEAAVTATATATATAVRTTTLVTTPTITTSVASSDSISHAGIALVTIGAVFLVAAIIALVFLYRKIDQRRRRDRATTPQLAPVELEDSLRKSEMPSDGGNLAAHELIGDRTEPAELHSQIGD